MEFTKLSEVIVAEEISEAAHVLVEDGGEVKRVAKTMVGGGPVGSGGGYAVYSSDAITAAVAVGLAKNLTPVWVRTTTNYMELASQYVLSTQEDCGDIIGWDVQLRCGQNNPIATANISEAQYNEIMAAWDALV